ncbi:hypothetical protein CCACVL1_23671 [Corchorus capsularis]|uniref:Uncharacterized protein n=1 Tax=Corchorus capsularis TaxID=210143 RepID=A0A1R3GTB3_COCAP|nr:hypothetical protein CCACVL1_23671 [Corchorus capsularis]
MAKALKFTWEAGVRILALPSSNGVEAAYNFKKSDCGNDKADGG